MSPSPAASSKSCSIARRATPPASGRPWRAADAERLIGAPLALNAKVARAPQPVDILMGGVTRVRHPLTGQVMLQRSDERRVERMPEFGTFAAGDTETVPASYIVPATLERVIDLLAAHGVRTRTLSRDTALDVERFAVSGTSVAERAFQGHRERSVQGAWRAERATIRPAPSLSR